MIKSTYNLTSVGSQAAAASILESIHFTSVPYRSVAVSVRVELGQTTVTFSDACPRDRLRARLREKTNRDVLWSRYRELKKRLPIIPSPTDISSNEKQSRMVHKLLSTSGDIDPAIDQYYMDCFARISKQWSIAIYWEFCYINRRFRDFMHFVTWVTSMLYPN